MANSKRKNKRRAPVARANDNQPASNVASAVPWSRRSDRHRMIAMTMASLVAGVFMVINLDRSMHSMNKQQRMAETSHHGWPAVYLERKATNPPILFVNRRLYPWPLPAVGNETRTWSLRNLGLNLAIGISTVGISYLVVNQLVQRYDRWKEEKLSL